MAMDLDADALSRLRGARALLPSRRRRRRPAVGGDLRLRASRDTRGYARDLGIAFQLTNIIRDVGEDARRGRIYLPQDELARFGVAPSSLVCGARDATAFAR